MSEQDGAAAPGQDENKLIAERRGKLARLREAGNPFPNDFRRSALAHYLQCEYADSTKDELEQLDCEYAVAGRLVRNRGAFLLIQDGSGQIQLYVDRRGLDAQTLDRIKSWDLGDIVGASGPIHKSGKGDLYINMRQARLLTQLLPVPIPQPPLRRPPRVRRPRAQRAPRRCRARPRRERTRRRASLPPAPRDPR